MGITLSRSLSLALYLSLYRSLSRSPPPPLFATIGVEARVYCGCKKHESVVNRRDPAPTPGCVPDHICVKKINNKKIGIFRII